MSSDNGNNPNDMPRQQARRGSVTQAALSSLFRSNSTSQNGTFPPPAMSAAAVSEQRRRLSITTLGLTNGPTPTAPFMRRGSVATSNDSESAIDDSESARTVPNTPFGRRMSFGAQAMRGQRTGGSPGANDQGFNWSEQMRSRAESSVAAGSVPRTSFSFGSGNSPPGGAVRPPPGHGDGHGGTPRHDRAKSVSDALPPPPTRSRKPDHMQERILKGDFYMD